jgi:polysaccharide export outer membrane protein
MTHVFRLTAPALLAVVLAAPVAAQEPKPAPVTPSANGPTSTPKADTSADYRLVAGDKLRIEVYKDPQLSQSLQIRPDGKVTLPLVGDVAAAGRTSNELRDTISASLKEYITNPVVTVIVVEATAAQAYVIGEVANPGTLVMQGPMTVMQALAQVGGLREFADRDDIRILRKTPTGTRTLTFNYKKAIRGELEPVYLQPGDTVVVP